MGSSWGKWHGKIVDPLNLMSDKMRDPFNTFNGAADKDPKDPNAPPPAAPVAPVTTTEDITNSAAAEEARKRQALAGAYGGEGRASGFLTSEDAGGIRYLGQ